MAQIGRRRDSANRQEMEISNFCIFTTTRLNLKRIMLDRLPPELILAICNELDRFQHRLRLLQICRRWRSVLWEPVHRRIIVQSSRTRLFLEAILNTPSIGTSIRDLRFAPYGSPPPSGSLPSLDPTLEDLVKQLSPSPEDTTAWLKDLQTNIDDHEQWIPLLLVFVPHLQTLQIGDLNWPNPKRLAWVVSRAALQQPPFAARPVLSKLQSLVLDFEEWKYVWDTADLLPFFYLPSLRTVDVESVKELSDDEEPPTTNPAKGTSPVEILKMNRLCNGRYGMASLITSCASLREFTYAHFNQVTWGEEYIDFHPRASHAALASQKHSLEVLHLLDDDSCRNDEPDDAGLELPWARWMGSLADFTVLRDLSLPAQNVIDYDPVPGDPAVKLRDTLPASLQRLRLTQCGEEHCHLLASRLQDMLTYRAERFPHLVELSILTEARELDEQALHNNNSGPTRPSQNGLVLRSVREAFEPVRGGCERVGVQFELSLTTGYESV